MKTNFRVLALGMGFASLALCVGCQEDQAKANGPAIANAGPTLALAQAEANATPAAPPPANPGEPPVPVVKNDGAPAPAVPPGSIIITRATATNAAPGTNIATA